MFDWDDLRHLLAIARAGSFAGAARELGVKHTTVSRRLDALEAADIAIRLHPGGEEDLLERKLGASAWSLYASVGYLGARGRPQSNAELASHALLGFESAALQGSPGGVWLREPRRARADSEEERRFELLDPAKDRRFSKPLP